MKDGRTRCSDDRMVARRGELVTAIHDHVGRAVRKGGPGVYGCRAQSPLAHDLLRRGSKLIHETTSRIGINKRG